MQTAELSACAQMWKSDKLKKLRKETVEREYLILI